jgi:predicted permease
MEQVRPMVYVFIEVLYPILVVMGGGFLLKRYLPIDIGWFNAVSTYVLNPVLVFITIIKIQITGDEVVRISLVSVIVCLAIGVMTYLLARWQRYDAHTIAALLLVTMFMNTGNYGLPASRIAFGYEGFERAMVYFIVQAILVQTLTIAVAHAGQSDWRTVLRQVWRMPPIYAALLGLLLRWLGFDVYSPNIVGSLLSGVNVFAQVIPPLLMVLLGMQLAQNTHVEDVQLTSIGVFIRLLISPLIAYGAAVLLELDPLTTKVVVLQASMPTAFTMVLYAREFNARPQFVSGSVVVSTVLSLVTLTLLLVMMGI